MISNQSQAAEGRGVLVRPEIVLGNVRCPFLELSSASPRAPRCCRFSGPHCWEARQNPSKPTPPGPPASLLSRALPRHGAPGAQASPWARLCRGSDQQVPPLARAPSGSRGGDGSAQSLLSASAKIPREERGWFRVLSEPRGGIFLRRPANPLSSHGPRLRVQQEESPGGGGGGSGLAPLHSSGQRSYHG